MSKEDASLNGASSANHCGSVWPCCLMIGRSLTVAYSARPSARCLGSGEKRRSGSSLSGIIAGAPCEGGNGAPPQSTGRCAPDRARRAVGIQRRKPARDLAGEARIGTQIVAEDRAQAQESARKRRWISAVLAGDAGEFARQRVGNLDLAPRLVDPAD